MTERDLDPARVPSAIAPLIHRLHTAGHQAYLVGGSVRDLIRGVPVADWDIATCAKPDQVMALFPSAIPTGIKHGTVTVPTAAGPCEVTTFRVEHGYADARRPDRVEFVGNIEDDLSRRDFTANAIAWDPESGREVDPFGGRADIAARRIRAVGNARERIARTAFARSSRALRGDARVGRGAETFERSSRRGRGGQGRRRADP
jgi:tRNA nucleotidyltransferase (CCA-adding enzyme)